MKTKLLLSFLILSCDSGQSSTPPEQLPAAAAAAPVDAGVAPPVPYVPSDGGDRIGERLHRRRNWMLQRDQ